MRLPYKIAVFGVVMALNAPFAYGQGQIKTGWQRSTRCLPASVRALLESIPQTGKVI